MVVFVLALTINHYIDEALWKQEFGKEIGPFYLGEGLEDDINKNFTDPNDLSKHQKGENWNLCTIDVYHRHQIGITQTGAMQQHFCNGHKEPHNIKDQPYLSTDYNWNITTINVNTS